MGTVATVAELPDCQICTHMGLPDGFLSVQPARYDARMHTGQWAFMCDQHFKAYAVSAHPSIGLGTGKGQMLIVG